MTVRFEQPSGDGGVLVVDPIEQRQLLLGTDRPTVPREADPAAFRFPVTAAAAFEAAEFELGRATDAYVRDSDGDALANVLSGGEHEFPEGEYVLEFGAPIKLYVHVTGPFAVVADADRIRVRLAGPTTVRVGARSYHERPAATITTPADPEPMMEAVSALSSALKTTTSERAYPTLRGHPPLLELGDELDVPDSLSTPDTGVELVVPPRYEYVYAAAPLAFYTGATLVSGDQPRLRTTDGWQYELSGWTNFEDKVVETLKQVFLLDCVVRTEGLYKVPLYERTVLEGTLPFDFADLYQRPIAEQLQSYLSVPYQAVADLVPNWVLTAHVPAEASGVEALPFVLNELGIVRHPRGRRIHDPTGRGVSGVALRDDGSVDDGPTRTRTADDHDFTLVQPEKTDESIEHAWFGEHFPRGATKATVEAYRSKLRRETPDDVIDITVVCNDREMLEEQERLDGMYGSSGGLPYDVTSHRNITADELADILTDRESDFLHFIGHATPDGLECRDGALDARDLDAVGVDVFLLNACQSYRQAAELTERGAIGGIGTVGDVENDYAAEVGRALAHLLSLGFHLRVALELVREQTVIGEQYLLFGDGSVDVAQTDDGIPLVVDIESRPGGTYDVSVTTYPFTSSYLGGFSTPTLSEVESYFLTPGTMGPWEFTEADLRTYLDSHSYPVRIDGTLRWNDDIEDL